MFCLKINNDTDKMFNIFKNVNDNYKLTIFDLVDIKGHDFTDEIVNSCNNFYLKQKIESK